MALRLLPHLLSKSSSSPCRPVALLNTLASGRTPFPLTAPSFPYTLSYRHYAKQRPKKEVKEVKGAKGGSSKGGVKKAKGAKVEEKEEKEEEETEKEKEKEEETEENEEKETEEKGKKEEKEEEGETKDETEVDDSKETTKDAKKKKKSNKDAETKDKPSKESKAKDKASKDTEGKDKVSKDTENKDKEDKEKEKAKDEAKDEEDEEETKSSKSRFGKKKPKKEKMPASVSKSTGNVLEDTIRQIEHVFGKGALMKLTSNTAKTVKLTPDEIIPTGSLGLDLALGVGGLSQGRITEIYGPESSGKTTLALHVIAEAQKQGKYCAFIDAEHALNPQWASKLGVNTDELLISQPDSGEQALEIVDSLIKAGKTNVIVIDSVAALVPKVELEGEMGDAHIGVQARLMSQALRKISPSLTKSKCVLIFINQIRMKIGVMFGNPETTTGGNALKFYSSVRLEIRRIGSVKKGEDIIGNQIRVKVAKNKLAPPFKEALFDIDFGKGISKLGEVIDWGVKAQVLEKMGAWYAYQGTQIGQGREKTKAYLEEHPDVAQEIEESIREKLLQGELEVDEAEANENAEDEKASDD